MLYTPEDLVGRQVLAVTNLPPRQIAGFRSEVLVLGLPTEAGEAVVLVGPERAVPEGLCLTASLFELLRLSDSTSGHNSSREWRWPNDKEGRLVIQARKPNFRPSFNSLLMQPT